MKSSIIAIFVAATTLGLGLSPAFAAPAHNKTGNECVREHDSNCGTYAGPSFSTDMSGNYRVVPSDAAPETMQSGSGDPCNNVIAGPDVSANLSGECSGHGNSPGSASDHQR